MSLEALNFNHPTFNAEQSESLAPKRPNLSLVLPEVQQIENLEIAPIYPNIEFNFRDEWLFGFKAVLPSADSRARAAFDSLRQGYPWLYGSINFAKASEADDRIQRWLKNKVNIPGREPIKREDAAPFSQIADNILTDYRNINHPISQMFDQLRTKYPALPTHAVRMMEQRVLSALAPDDVRNRYNLVFKELKLATSG